MVNPLRAPSAQRNRFLLTVGALAVVLGFLFLARGALFPFLIGLVLSYLLLPLVRWIEQLRPVPEERRDRARLLAVISVYLMALIMVLLIVGFVFPLVFRQVSKFIELLPTMVDQAQETFSTWAAEYQSRVPPEVRARIEESIGGVAQNLADTAQEAAVRTILVISQTFSVLLGLAIIPVWLFYVLKDQHKVKGWVFQLLPPVAQGDAEAVLGIMDRVLSSYIRAQLFLGLVVGIMVFVGLTLMGVQFALVLGIIAGITELIPILGPILGSIPVILVTLANSPDRVVWVVLMYVAVQQVENNFLVPRIQGSAVQMHPAVIMTLIILASEVAGFWGMLLIIPLTAVARDVFLYLYQRFTTEE